MPKRVKNIFKKKITLHNMLEAYKRAAKGKSGNKEVILFGMNLGSNLYEITNDIYNDRYKMGIYRKFVIYDKINKCAKKYPRQGGKPRKEPL